jgi:hypothetical protein
VVAAGPVAGLAEELAQARLGDDPLLASFMGASGYDDAVADLSPAARQAWRDRLVDVLVRCEHLEADAGDEDFDSRVLLAAIRDDAARALALADSRVQEFAVTALPLVSGPSLMLLVAARVSLTDAASAAAYLTRCRGWRPMWTSTRRGCGPPPPGGCCRWPRWSRGPSASCVATWPTRTVTRW